jgi:hypothetical protein
MMTLTRKHIALIVVALALGWWLGQPARRPQPLEDRPVVRWIVRAAKQLLWIAVFVEEPPAEQPAQVQAVVGEDGYVKVDHGRGW